MKFLKSGVLLILPMLIVSCKGDSSPKPHIKLHELGIEVNQEKLSEGQRRIMNKVASEEIVDLSVVTNSVLSRHKTSFLDYTTLDVKFTGSNLDKLRPLNESSDDDMDLHEFKMSYEAELKKMHDSEAMLYNKGHVSVFSSVYENRMQCYSGTILFDVLLRDQKGSDYYKMNQVFIYESGHVLPGYMVNEAGQWHLYGVETTVGGKAKKTYGPTKDLERVRVVDAHVAMALDALQSEITNPQKVMVRALRKTAELYDIPLDSIEDNLLNTLVPLKGDADASQVAKNTADYLNSSLFSFGSSSSVPSGDRARPNIDEMDANSGSAGFASLLSREGVFEGEVMSFDNRLFQIGDVILLRPSADLFEVLEESRSDLLFFSAGELLSYDTANEGHVSEDLAFLLSPRLLIPGASINSGLVPHHFIVSKAEVEGRSEGEYTHFICLSGIYANSGNVYDREFVERCIFDVSMRPFEEVISVVENDDGKEDIVNESLYSLDSLIDIFGGNMGVGIIKCSNEEVAAENVLCPNHALEEVKNLVPLPMVQDEESEVTPSVFEGGSL